ncbi:MAG: ATP-dependent DNA helicase, partial [Acidimicrobiia bacterium]|nr:ATP-dependent DNA helicase [Acidimicrobiia bacterium]
YEGLRLESTFDYRSQAMLYIGSDLPDPRTAEFQGAALAEIAALVEHAGGRALVLTTSHKMVDLAVRQLAHGPFRVLAQGDLPRTALLNEFSSNETSVLVATMGYWEGIDIPGPSLSLVVIDKIPFPRPDDPLTQARRDRVEATGGSAFNAVDLPRAAMLLAQGSGRLIRNEVDRGVVAILDNRLTAKRYGIRLIRSLPPMQRTSDRERAIRFLQSL